MKNRFFGFDLLRLSILSGHPELVEGPFRQALRRAQGDQNRYSPDPAGVWI
ncbi:MAG: hypothetical protein HYV07_05260 [Deltaproteobacteria bacterium]|nr:hypothetical protein [Deltaproteobacteria bacterium]